MPEYYATSAWPMLRSEGVWTLNLRLASSVGRGLNTKTSTLTLQDARLPCDKRRAYAVVGGGLGAEPAIRLLGRKDSIQNQAPRLCRMPACHATSAWPMLWSEGVWTLNMRLDSPIGRVAYKNGHPDFAGCPFAMRQAHGLCCGRRKPIR